MSIVDTQHSAVCIIDGAFTWQRDPEHGSSHDELSSGPAAADVPLVDHCSNEEAVLVHEPVPSNSIRPTLINISFTIPKVNYMFRFLCQISAVCMECISVECFSML